jgi:chromate reductase
MKILAFSGSARALSFNTKLLRIAVKVIREIGATVTEIGLKDYGLPIYDSDLVARDGFPPTAFALRQVFLAHDGLLIASPEYNGSVTALLKNSLDWCSLPIMGQDGLAPFRGKPAGLLAASPSPFGGVRSLGHLRGILSKMGMHVIAEEVMVPVAAKAFTAEGALADAATVTLLATLCRRLIRESKLSVEHVAT